MKRLALYFLLLILIITANNSFAQNSIIAGKIVDGNNNPICGATIRVSKAGKVIEATSDNDGLFYSQLLHSDYYHLDVVTERKNLKVNRIYLPPQDKNRVYYYLKVSGNKVQITVDDEDPFMNTKLSKIEADDNMNIDGRRLWRFVIIHSIKDSVTNESTSQPKR